MNQIITAMFILLFVLKTEAKKMVYPVEIMTGISQLIVIGEIKTVKSNYYIFDIKETLKGKFYKSIAVNVFDDWTCDTRFAKPKKGQNLCLFLKKGTNNWEIINGSTGELQILNNFITLGGDEEYKHVDYKFTPYRLPILEFTNGIKEFSKCYKFVGEFDFRDNNAHFEQICNNKQVLKFKNINKFSAWLYKKMTKYQVIRA